MANDDDQQQGNSIGGERLGEALDDLEQMLGRNREPEPELTPASAGSDSPYTIPLLDEVVVPGQIDGGLGGGMEQDYSEAPVPAALCNRLAERLASEIEVIMVARLENALREASEEIRRQVRNHIEIVLPEILDELAREEGEPPELE